MSCFFLSLILRYICHYRFHDIGKGVCQDSEDSLVQRVANHREGLEDIGLLRIPYHVFIQNVDVESTFEQ